jgi:hypothetical protein
MANLFQSEEKKVIIKYSIGIVFLLLILVAFILLAAIPKKTTANLNQTTNYPSVNANNTTENVIGNKIFSYSDLNQIALDQDCVFLYVPSESISLVPAEVYQAIMDAQAEFKIKGITAGIFTLSTTAPEYANMSKGVPLPALLVASKGKSMAFVQGAISMTSIIETYNKANVQAPSSCLTPSDGSGGCSVPNSTGSCKP